MASAKFTDEWIEQGVRCRVYPKKGQRDVAEYVECFVSRSIRYVAYIKGEETPHHAATHHRRFAELVASAGDMLALLLSDAPVVHVELETLRLIMMCTGSSSEAPEVPSAAEGPVTDGRLSNDVDPANIVASERSRAAPERFSESKYSQWSAYDMSRLDGRHNSVREAVDEARSSEPTLAAELDSLFSQLYATTSAAVDTDPASELVGEMERVAATTLQSALLELLHASGVNQEDCFVWTADAAPPAVYSVRACMPVSSEGYTTEWGELLIAPPSLKWTPDPEASAAECDDGQQPECGACPSLDPIEWPLASFAGVNEDPMEHALNQLRLLQGEDDGLLFGFKSPSDLALFERTFCVAARSAAAAASETVAPTVSAAGDCAPPQMEAPSNATAKRQKRSEEPRVRRGRELHEALSKVANHFSHDRTALAKAAFAAIPAGPTSGESSILKRAKEMRSLLFTFGGLSTTKAVIQKFLTLGEVQRLLDEDFGKSRQEVIDAETATELLLAAKRYLNQMHARASGGRRTDAERNAFWAAVVSLMPAELIDNRQGRSMMRILGISYKTMKEANTMRRALEDNGKAWVLLTTKRHFDNIEAHWEIFDDWIHSSEASTADNAHKEQIRIYRGYPLDPMTGRRGYGLHWRRAQEGNVRELLRKWHASAACQKFRVATATPKRPQGVKLSSRMLVKWRCLCVKLRAATFADCKICSFVEESLKQWHKKRFGWRTEYLKKHPEHESSCHICSNPDLAKSYREMSRSVDDLRRVLLPCGKTEYPNYSVKDGPTFKAFNGLCCRNRCPKKTLMSTAGACHWSNIFGADCAAEATADEEIYNKWLQRSRTTVEEGKEGDDGKKKTFTTDEWAPFVGTRAGMLKDIRAALETGANPYFWHTHRSCFIRYSIKLHESRKDGVTATELADYAAVLDTPREKTGTCSVPERSNELVVVMGYKPYMQTVVTPARGKRPASTKQVRKQHVDLFFAFHPSGYKPNAKSYNTAAEDIDCFLKYGRVRHGEWFHERQRLPGGDHSRPLPDDFSERPEQPPDFPEYERKVSIKDGCAMQFDGKDNYHQVAEWKGKTAPREADRLQAVRIIQARFHSRREALLAAAERSRLEQSRLDAEYAQVLAAAERSRLDAEYAQELQKLEQLMAAAASGIGRVDWKLETMHGKNVCDPLSNMPYRTLQEAIELGHLLLVGTREKVIYMARHRATPATAKLWKEGWWTVDRIFWGYYDHRQFTELNVPKANGFKDSHECHLFAGLGADADEARLNGPLTVRSMVCACEQCTAGNFKSCMMSAVTGTVRNVKVPRTEKSALRQMDSLHLWAASCRKGQLAATRVHSSEACLEGLYYLVQLLCVPYTVEKDTIFNTDTFEAGDLVVRISYYKLIDPSVEGGFRSYELLDGKTRERLIHVSSLIRLQGLIFSQGPGGPAGRGLRSADGKAKVYYLSRESDNSIQSCCWE